MPTPIQLVIDAVDHSQRVLAANIQALQEFNTKAEANNSIFAKSTQIYNENKIALKAIAIALGTVEAAFILMTKGAIQNADDLGKLSQKTGFTVESLSTLQFAAEQSNVNLGELQIGLKTLSKSMVDAQDDTSQSAKSFRALGLSVVGTNGQLKTSQEIFFGVADAFQNMADGAEKSALATDLFGRSASELIPLLNQGSAGIGEMQAMAARLGLTVSADFAKQANQFNDSLGVIKGGLKGTANTIAQDLLPVFLKISEFVIDNQRLVSVAFVGISAAVALGTSAFVTYRAIILACGIATQFFGLGSIRTFSEMRIALALLNAQMVTYLNSTRLAAAVAPFGTFIVAVAAVAAAVIAGSEAWVLFKNAKLEALSTSIVEESNDRVRASLTRQINDFEKAGKITVDRAIALKKQLDDAFKPTQVISSIPSGVGAPGIDVKEFVRNQEAEQAALKATNKELKIAQDLFFARQSIASGTRTDKSRAAEIESDLSIFKARQSLREAELESDFSSQEKGLVTIQQFAERKKQLVIETAVEETRSVSALSSIAQEEARKKIELDAKNSGATQAKIELDINESKQIITSEATAKIIGINAKRDEQLLKINSDTAQRIEQKDRALGDTRLFLAEQSGQRLLAEQARINEQFDALQKSVKGVAPGPTIPTTEAIEQARKIALNRAEQSAVNDLARAKLDLALAEAQLAQSLIEGQADLSDLQRKRQLVPVLERINQLLNQKAALEQRIITSAVSTDEDKIKAAQQVLDIQRQTLAVQQEQSRVPKSELPRFDQALGFRHEFQDGQIVTTSQLLEPWQALDTFLATTMTQTFSGISQAITGLIEGTKNWGQVAAQIQHSILAGLVQLVLEYTVFHQIRMLLDRIFYTAKQTQITTTAAVGQTAATTTAATQAGAAATTAAAWSPAATLASVGSFGVAGIIGLAVVLAALAAVSGAFAQGGVVTGSGGSKEDKVLIRASPGEGVITKEALDFYGGESWLDDINKKKLRTVESEQPKEFHPVASASDLLTKIQTDRTAGISQPTLPALEMQKILLKIINAQQFKDGGILRGAGGPTDDRIAIWASNGEGIITAAATQHYGGQRFIDAINQKNLHWQMQHFAEGGIVERNVINSPSFSEQSVSKTEVLMPRIAQQPPTVNVAPAGVNVAVLKNTRSDIREFFDSTEGKKYLLDLTTGAKIELGLGT